MENSLIKTKLFKLSPTKKTSHFLFLLLFFDAIIFIAIIFITNPASRSFCEAGILGVCEYDPRKYLSGILLRVSALLNINIIFLMLYAGFTSYFHNRRIIVLVIIAFIFLWVATVINFI